MEDYSNLDEVVRQLRAIRFRETQDAVELTPQSSRGPEQDSVKVHSYINQVTALARSRPPDQRDFLMRDATLALTAACDIWKLPNSSDETIGKELQAAYDAGRAAGRLEPRQQTTAEALKEALNDNLPNAAAEAGAKKLEAQLLERFPAELVNSVIPVLKTLIPSANKMAIDNVDREDYETPTDQHGELLDAPRPGAAKEGNTKLAYLSDEWGAITVQLSSGYPAKWLEEQREALYKQVLDGNGYMDGNGPWRFTAKNASYSVQTLFLMLGDVGIQALLNAWNTAITEQARYQVNVTEAARSAEQKYRAVPLLKSYFKSVARAPVPPEISKQNAHVMDAHGVALMSLIYPHYLSLRDDFVDGKANTAVAGAIHQWASVNPKVTFARTDAVLRQFLQAKLNFPAAQSCFQYIKYTELFWRVRAWCPALLFTMGDKILRRIAYQGSSSGPARLIPVIDAASKSVLGEQVASTLRDTSSHMWDALSVYPPEPKFHDKVDARPRSGARPSQQKSFDYINDEFRDRVAA